MRDVDELFAALGRSRFRSSFKLNTHDRNYLHAKGLPVIGDHARDFIAKRLAPDVITNDGKQTPYRGHPVFVAQHATACCCRGCLYKWHQIPEGRLLNTTEQKYIVTVLLRWLENTY